MYWLVCPCQYPDGAGSSSVTFGRSNSSSSISSKIRFQTVLCCSQQLYPLCLRHEVPMPSITQAQVCGKRETLLNDFTLPSWTPVSLALCSVSACTWYHCSLATQFLVSCFNSFVVHPELRYGDIFIGVQAIWRQFSPCLHKLEARPQHVKKQLWHYLSTVVLHEHLRPMVLKQSHCLN